MQHFTPPITSTEIPWTGDQLMQQEHNNTTTDSQVKESTNFIHPQARQQMLFVLGQVVLTIGARDAFLDAQQEPYEFLTRHVTGDWGQIDEHDRAENELSVKEGFRILSAYNLSTGVKIWVITEADRSSTTILLPAEY